MTKIDYANFLHVTDDGHIWWLRQDALRLAAGFVPVCDDNQQLEPRLQAPNQRALVNEKNLMAALGDARSNIRKPTAFERDGFRYVDAAEFLEWLSQYICQTQAKIEFPNELVNQVRIALAKAAAERPPFEPKAFESLTLALEGEFDKPLDALPVVLRQRVEKEFFPMPWDSLSAEQRRSVARQLDYQRDPATEADRQFWWDFFERMHEVQAQIKEWERTETPTATDKSIKEARLKELRQVHERMKLQQKQARGDYLPAHKGAASVRASSSAEDFIAYPKAMRLLTEKLDATPDELAVWIFLGPDTGGLAAYLNANELPDPPRFHFDCFMGKDYLAPMMACWFRQSEIDSFVPGDRYITGVQLIERWGTLPGIRAEPFICAKIAESRLLDLHPTFGGTRGTFSETDGFPPLSAGLFALSHIKQIEAEDALSLMPIQSNPGQEPPAPQTTTRNAGETSSSNNDPCAVFRQMPDLRPNEISISILGDASESGLTGNGMLEISARGTTRRLALAEIGLVNRITGALNEDAAILVGFAHGEKYYRTNEAHSAKMKRLRAVFRNRLGLYADPFTKHSKENGWQPLFSIVDLRGRADDRAKEKAARRTVSLDQMQEQGRQFAAADEGVTGEDVTADEWMKESGHSWKS